ncbi:MAG TPA: zf-HC2 domain-containing protein [Anaeromyxobacteraceae bacterium]|nr:zf-HC2 domain-containing protein [Anaeromyxobacteraceae bacterium]
MASFVPMRIELPRCDQVADALSELLDGDLDGPVAMRVEIHLATCPPCARLARELAATVAALRRRGRRAGRGPR